MFVACDRKGTKKTKEFCNKFNDKEEKVNCRASFTQQDSRKKKLMTKEVNRNESTTVKRKSNAFDVPKNVCPHFKSTNNKKRENSSQQAHSSTYTYSFAVNMLLTWILTNLITFYLNFGYFFHFFRFSISKEIKTSTFSTFSETELLFVSFFSDFVVYELLSTVFYCCRFFFFLFIYLIFFVSHCQPIKIGGKFILWLMNFFSL